MNKTEAKQALMDTMEKFLALASRRLPDDVYEKLTELRDKETSPMQKVIYDAYFQNLEEAEKLKRPSCQDTGQLHYYIKAGTAFPHLDIVEESLQEATKRATMSVPLRQNTINYFEEKNTGDNTGERIPWINWDIVSGEMSWKSSCILPEEDAACRAKRRYLSLRTAMARL